MNHALSWSMRIMHQTQMSESACFITATYDDAHLPDNKSLDVAHPQAFVKALRRKLPPFTYYLCGEYGGITLRPHYHLCLMGTEFISDRTLYKKTKTGDSLYTSELLNSAWPHGHANFGALTQQSACYVASYINKKIKGPGSELAYRTLFLDASEKTAEVHQLKPEFSTMSRRPGLGTTWFNKFYADVYPADEVIINGIPRRPPAFYDKLLERRDPDLHHFIKRKRILRGNQHLEDQTAERLATREFVAMAKRGSQTRDTSWQY